jgi:AraC-like DNA-binding protein
MEPLPEICSLIARHAGPGEIASVQTGIPDLKVTAARVTTEPVSQVYEPAYRLVAQGAKSIALGDKVFEYGAGQYLVVSVDLPITSHINIASEREPYLSMGLILRPATVAALLLETAASDQSTAVASGVGVSKAPGELVDALLRLLRLLDHPRDVPVIAPLIEREILWRLLCGEQGAMLWQIGLADSRLSQISHAIKWIRANYAQILRIEDLAQMAAMSLSSFHRHFRAVTSMSPSSTKSKSGYRRPVRGSSRSRQTWLRSALRSVTTAHRSSAVSTVACTARRPDATRLACEAPRRSNLARDREPPSAVLVWRTRTVDAPVMDLLQLT